MKFIEPSQEIHYRQPLGNPEGEKKHRQKKQLVADKVQQTTNNLQQLGKGRWETFWWRKQQ